MNFVFFLSFTEGEQWICRTFSDIGKRQFNVEFLSHSPFRKINSERMFFCLRAFFKFLFILPLIQCQDLAINVKLVPYVRGRNRKPLPWSRHGIWSIFRFLSLECVIIDNRSCGWKRWVVILFSELIKNHYNSTKLDAHSISYSLFFSFFS